MASDRLHRPIRPIPNLAGNVPLRRLASHKVSKTDSLNPTRNHYP